MTKPILNKMPKRKEEEDLEVTKMVVTFHVHAVNHTLVTQLYTPT